MTEDASTFLTSHAEERSHAIFSALNNRRLSPSDLDGFRVAYDVAARLQLISTYLRSLPPYWIESDVEQLCRTVLRDLQAFTRPTKGPTSSTLLPSLPKFASLFGQNGSTDAERCIVAFFRVQRKDAQRLKSACDDLLNKLTQGENDEEELPNSALQHLDTPHTSAEFNNDFFRALQLIAECNPALHNTSHTTTAIQQESQALWHPARLCLHETENNQNLVSPHVKVLVPAMGWAFWQEFCLMIQTESTLDGSQQLLSRGGFCSILERRITARLFLSFKHGHGLFFLEKAQVLNQLLQGVEGESLATVLRNYDLTPRDKVLLSYAIARSFWKYYNSELMQARWTSDTIWFMPEESSRRHEGKLPLYAYLSFPFGIPSNTTPDVLDEELLTHRCPKIFDIGVLLLEIGLAEPFRTGNRRDRVAQANLSHKIATDEMLELEKTDWDGFANSKKYFDAAVKYCLNDKNFIPPSEQPRTTRHGGVFPTSTRPATALDWQAGVLKRRRIFFKNVVCPLAWLAQRGFGARAGDIPYVNKREPSTSAQNVSSNIPSQPEPDGLFHSAIVPKMWLSDLMKISRQVESKRRECRVTAPVRVAILDTGLNLDQPIFTEKNGLLKSITHWRDYVKPGALTLTDTFGHGTFMARLIMECAPGAEILVARVAENTHELKNSQASIKEAILWAGQTGKADIIFMSFGFPTDDQGIREAIETVQKKRKEEIIFLASAGNSSTDDESFPARHPSVISVYATNCHGAFLQSNSASITNGAAVLGTYGDDIPDSLREEFKTTYPKICEPGSSVATAVMAGICATMLAYASVLPSLVRLQGVAASTSHAVLQRLWTTKGMEAMLYRLAQDDQDRPRLKAVKPMWFWKRKPDDTERYCAIRDTLSDIARRFPSVRETG